MWTGNFINAQDSTEHEARTMVKVQKLGQMQGTFMGEKKKTPWMRPEDDSTGLGCRTLYKESDYVSCVVR
jgi:hypothetical protein